jgi:hypothetical protein
MRAMQRLLLDERIAADGRYARTWAILDAGALRVEDDDGGSGPMPVAALDRVMCRYGLPLGDDVVVDPASEALDLGDGRCLRRLRHHAPVDATGRDYLVWERAGEVPIAVLATHATAALRYLALRFQAERDPSEI